MLKIKELRILSNKIGLKPHPRSKEEKLIKEIKIKCKELNKTFNELVKEYFPSYKEDTTDTIVQLKETKDNKRIEALRNFSFNKIDKEEKEQKIKDVNKLLRVIVTCQDPDRQSLSGQIFEAKNSKIGAITCYVPFNVETHIPLIIYNQLLEYERQYFIEKKQANNPEGISVESKTMPLYNITILPPLNAEKLENIRQRQLAENQFSG